MAPFIAAAKPDVARVLNAFREQSARLIDLEAKLAQLQVEVRNQNATLPLLTAARAMRSSRLSANNLNGPSYEAAKAKDIEVYLKDLRKLRPHVFDVWKTLFENGKVSYYEQREASCSHRDNWYANLFASYIDVHAFGRLLDIGCGPHGLPSYLHHYDVSLISGLEPLEATGPVDFEFVRGFNEFLPWRDGAFSTVVSGTSLDHVISLEQSLAEVKRVLSPDGRYLVWLASVPGAPAYDESAANPKAIDDFHLFHFDRVWVEPLFERFFRIHDVTVVTQPGFDHVFYCLLPRK